MVAKKRTRYIIDVFLLLKLFLLLAILCIVPFLPNTAYCAKGRGLKSIRNNSKFSITISHGNSYEDGGPPCFTHKP